MKSRELVVDLVNQLLEYALPAGVADRIELLAGIRKARLQARRGGGVPAEAARKLVDAWTSR